MNDQITPMGKDPHLWHLAQRRASFKRHLAAYAILNIFFWVLWYVTHEGGEPDGLPWPVWPMLGWGIGVAFHYASAYLATGDNTVEREYHKLVQQQNKQ
ncbi:MAG TPA: 2TM domain-containing protein [Chitinophagaceae bacterium]